MDGDKDYRYRPNPKKILQSSPKKHFFTNAGAKGDQDDITVRKSQRTNKTSKKDPLGP